MAVKDIVGGTDGAITASGFNCDLDAWSASVGAEDTASWRTFTSKWKKKKNIGYGLSGQFSGTIQFDAATTKPVPSATGGQINPTSFEGVSFTLTATVGCTFTFTGNVTVLDVQRPAADRMTGTYRFEADGPVSITWDETP